MASKSPYFDFAKDFEIFWNSGKSPLANNGLQKMKRTLRLLITALSIVAKALYLKWVFRQELKSLFARNSERFNVFRSFSFRAHQNYQDPFWSDLIKNLADKNEAQLVVYQPGFSVRNCKKLYDPKIQNFPYFVFIGPAFVFKTFFDLVRESYSSIEFRGDFRVNGQDLKPLIIQNYQSELLLPTTLATLCFEDAFRTIFLKLELKKLFIPFENNPWEKMLYLARKSSGGHFPILGYQHSCIPEGAANYFLSDYEVQKGFAPDQIRTVGPQTAALLKSYPAYRNLEVLPGCALRYGYLYQAKNQDHVEPRGDRPVRLFVPLDGTSDAVKMLDLLQDFARKFQPKNINIRLREHPDQPLSILDPSFRNRLLFGKNISVSTVPLDEDLKWCDLVLYTGTAISIEALMLGKGLINFNFSNFNYDPVFQFKEFKWQVGNPDELFDAITQFSGISGSTLVQKQQQAKDFAIHYFNPCTKESIERFF